MFTYNNRTIWLEHECGFYFMWHHSSIQKQAVTNCHLGNQQSISAEIYTSNCHSCLAKNAKKNTILRQILRMRQYTTLKQFHNKKLNCYFLNYREFLCAHHFSTPSHNKFRSKSPILGHQQKMKTPHQWSGTQQIAKYFKFRRHTQYCKTLNVCVPFISRDKQNCKIKGHEYQLQAKKQNEITTVFRIIWF